MRGGYLFGRVSFPKAKGKGSFPKSGSGGGGIIADDNVNDVFALPPTNPC